MIKLNLLGRVLINPVRKLLVDVRFALKTTEFAATPRNVAKGANFGRSLEKSTTIRTDPTPNVRGSDYCSVLVRYRLSG